MINSEEFPEKIHVIQNEVSNENYRFTIHSLERRIERGISKSEIEQAILDGEIIEYYPEDKYGPSCLILGYSKMGRPLHIQCSINPVWIITCYDPRSKKDEWSNDFKERR